MKYSLILFTAFLTILISPTIVFSQPAFPGAEGFGANAIGGRGGTIYEVTNLNDSGPGSLREAVEAKGPRIVVFRLSGTIPLKSILHITNPYITIAGQTAPGDGICLKNYELNVKTSHVIIRYIRSRPGDSSGEENHGFNIGGGKNIIVDHCSASWSVDETLSATTSGELGNVTVQWCMITESLNNSVHRKGPHGYGSLIRSGMGNGITYHHNLYTHHSARLPRPGNLHHHSEDPDGFIFDFRNNVVYNWGGSKAGYNADGRNKTDSITKMNFVGNFYKSGVNSSDNIAFEESTIYDRAYFSGNYMNSMYPQDPWSLVRFTNHFSEADKEKFKQSSPIQVAPVRTDDAITAYLRVLLYAGATLPKRDPVDIRVINHVISGTGRIIDDEDEVGGWPELRSEAPPKDSDHDGMPDDWEREHNLSPSDYSDAKSTNLCPEGYTNIEVYINGLVDNVFGVRK